MVVRRVAESLAHDNLGRHPVGRPNKRIPLLVVLPVLSGHPEVRDLDAALRGEEHVASLQVPVDDPVAM